MTRKYVMTPARRAALRRAQMISAHKRRGHGHGKLAVEHVKYDRLKHKMSIMKGVTYGAALAGGVAGGVIVGSYVGHGLFGRRPAFHPRKRRR